MTTATLDTYTTQARTSQASAPAIPSLTPDEAWELVQQGRATLVDVRSAEERRARGAVPGSRHAAWATGPALIRNPRFLKELEAQVSHEETVLFLCAAGKRSVPAAQAAAKAGYASVASVAEGYEGIASEGLLGWRNRNLPWNLD